MLPFPEVLLQAGDHLVIRDTPDRLKEFEKVLGGTLYPEDSEKSPVDGEHPLLANNQQIAEIVIVDGSGSAGEDTCRAALCRTLWLDYSGPAPSGAGFRQVP